MTQQSIAEVLATLTADKAANRTGKQCIVVSVIALLSEDNRAVFDEWAESGRGPGGMSQKQMAKVVGSVTGVALSPSSLGNHVRGECCCYGLT